MSRNKILLTVCLFICTVVSCGSDEVLNDYSVDLPIRPHIDIFSTFKNIREIMCVSSIEENIIDSFRWCWSRICHRNSCTRCRLSRTCALQVNLFFVHSLSLFKMTIQWFHTSYVIQSDLGFQKSRPVALRINCVAALRNLGYLF